MITTNALYTGQRANATSKGGTGTPAGGNLGKDEFLQLLVTQLRYQDPLNPSKPEEFASQLAQFTSLERMQNIETILQGQTDATSLGTLAMKADLGASFIGRNVIAGGNALEVTSGDPATVTVNVSGTGGKTTLQVFDASGREVSKQELGFRNGGRQTLTAGTLPTGEYTYKVSVTDAAGADVAVQTYTSGIIDGVSFQGGTVVLRSGRLTFPLDNVVEVERAPAGAAAVAAVARARILPINVESLLP
ncbi:MAG: flagellar hook capping FlgD N-terminal domain-containing protein [Gemmatimonadota bacterium]|nr:flagellar hook capping FlgD N-terminal domain-containing protein [Gemmatimonadota bacterium]